MSKAANYLYASIWHCGDHVCDCSQAKVEKYSPNPNFKGAWRIEELWAGTYVSNPGVGKEGVSIMRAELIEAADRFGIVLEDDPRYPLAISGKRDLNS